MILDDLPGWTTEFDLIYRQEYSASAGGDIYRKDFGIPLWKMSLVTKNLTPNQLDYWRGALMDLEKGMTFEAYSKSRCYPIARPNGTGPSLASIVSIASNFHQLVVSVDFLQAGDLIEFDDLYLHRVVSASGASITIEPPLHPSVTVSSIINLTKPSTMMVLIPDTLNIQSGLDGRGNVSFQAIEYYNIFRGEDQAIFDLVGDKILIVKDNVLSSYTIDEALAEGILTFTRASGATYVNSEGLISTASNNVPRIQYDPITKERLGYLPEPAKTNLLLRSQEFGTTWSLYAASVGSNVIISPDGTLTGDKIIENSATKVAHGLQQFINFSNGLSYTFSCYIKAAERNWVRINLPGAVFTVGVQVWVDLANGVFGTIQGSPTNTSIQNAGNGWWRVSISKTSTAATGGNCPISIATADGVSTYNGDGSSGIYVWGAQLESNAFATSYIPTTTATVTRATDTLEVNLNNIKFNQVEGTVISDWYRGFSIGGNYSPWTIDTGSNSVSDNALYHYTSVFSYRESASYIFFLNTGSAPVGRIKSFSLWKSGNNSLTVNGIKVSNTTTFSGPSTPRTRMVIGPNAYGLIPTSAPIRFVKLFPRALTNTEVTELL